MSKFLCKAILSGVFRIRTLATTTINLHVLRNLNVGPSRLFSICPKKQSFTVSYLTQSLGFSPNAALTASKRVAFETSEKPDKLVSLFREYGFTESQISCIFRLRPTLLMADKVKNILPKLEFFNAKGFSWPELTKGISLYPAILTRSLDNHIIPTYEIFRNVFNDSEENVILAVSRCPDLLAQNVEKCIKPNIDILKGYGVSDSHIAAMFMKNPSALIRGSVAFSEAVQRVAEIGFNPLKYSFVSGVHVIRSMSQSKWESKINAYKKWGLSDEEILNMFVRNPLTLRISVEKISSAMEFLVNEVGLSVSCVTKVPQLVGLSLEKRLIPRHFVYRVLLSKGLVNDEEANLRPVFESPENKFLRKFVVPYVENGTAPELLKLYNDKLKTFETEPKTIEV